MLIMAIIDFLIESGFVSLLDFEIYSSLILKWLN